MKPIVEDRELELMLRVISTPQAFSFKTKLRLLAKMCDKEGAFPELYEGLSKAVVFGKGLEVISETRGQLKNMCLGAERGRKLFEVVRDVAKTKFQRESCSRIEQDEGRGE